MAQERTALFRVEVRGLIEQETELQYADFADGRLGPHVDVLPIVPAFAGNATPFPSLLEMIRPLSEATHVIFHASDEFQATIPLGDLEQALLLFQTPEQTPLQKGFPVRLIVPNGSSECLNVKSVVRIEFVAGDREQEATYGFKNLVAPSEL